MIIRIRQPGGIVRDSDNVPASARIVGHFAGASRYGYIGGERVTPLPMGHAEDQRRYRERKAATA